MRGYHRVVRFNGFKVVLMVFAVVLFPSLPTYVIPDEAEVFYIKLRVDCDSIYEINCEYSLGGELQSRKGIQNANPEEPIPLGDTVWLEFTHWDFEYPKKLKSSKFSINFTVVDINGNECPAMFSDSAGNALTDRDSFVRFDKEYDLALSYDSGGYFYTQIE